MKSDLYISADIEADGPIPGRYSMLAFGLALAGTFDGEVFTALNPTRASFYEELQPISNDYEEDALKVSRLDRQALARNGKEPSDALTKAAEWVRTQAGGHRPVLVGFPAAFDWMFLYWYFVRFSNSGSPFDFSACLDMKTMYQQKARVVSSKAGLGDLPSFLRSTRPHTHNALDDAVEQADIFVRLFRWDGR
jgi:3'-5' exoribonuclease Rv2179c-like domain